MKIEQITDFSCTEKKMKLNRHLSKGIVFDGRYVYILKYGKYDFYTLLGGGIEEGESAKAAFLREIEEESGIICEIVEEVTPIVEYRCSMEYSQHNSVFFARYLTERNKNRDRQEVSDDIKVKKVLVSEAINLLFNQSNLSKQQQFLNLRDIIIMTEYLKYQKKNEFELTCSYTDR